MFCDLVNSTQLANELDPEDLADVLRAYRNCISDAIARWRGHIAKFYGDGVLIYFGWPQARENDAERAVHAGLDLAAGVGRLSIGDKQPLACRVGIATGVVMIGELIGEGFAQEETVVGSIPNLAARLQALAEPGAVVTAASTYRLVGAQFECTSLGRHLLKGLPEEIEVWQPQRSVEATRFQTRLSQRLTPFVGRAQESNVLRELWEQAAQGNGQSAVLVGEAGIGKSRLVQALREALADAPHTELHWQCSPFHANSALHPVIQSLMRLAEIASDDPPEIRRQKAETLLARAGGDLEASASVFKALFAHKADEYPAPTLEVKFQQVIELAVQFALNMASEQPLLLAVEDAHWADPSTLEAMNQLLATLRTRRILVIITTRPDANMGWARENRAVHLNLDRLANSSVRAMIDRLAGEKPLPAEVVEAILSTTDGIPLFVEELTRMVLESGQLRDMGDRFTLRGSVLDLSIPATLHDSLAARLDRLAADKPLAQVAATIGRAFSSDLLGHLVEAPEVELRDALLRLCEAGILEQRGDRAGRRYVFRHGLIQEAAYHSQLKARRRELHARVGQVLEEQFPEESKSVPHTLAHHFAEAGMPEAAARYALAASRNALRLAATSEAVAHLNKGLELIAALPSSPSCDLLKLRLHASLGTALMVSKSWAAPEAEAAYSAANALSHAATDPIEAMWILWGVFVYHQVRGNMEQAASACDRVRAAAEGHRDTNSRLVADMISVQVSFYTGRFDDAVRHCSAVTAGFSAAEHRSLINLYTIDLELVSTVHHAIACWMLGRPSEALALTMQAERLARSIEHPYSIAWTLTWGSMAYLLREDLDELAERLEEGIAIADQHGFSYIGALGRMMQGWCNGRKGALADGIAEMRGGLETFQATGAAIAVPYFRTLLAELLGTAGHAAEGLDLLAEAEGQIGRLGESWPLAEVYRVRGDIHANGYSAGSDIAESCYNQSLAVAVQQGAQGWQSRARTSLARLADQAEGGLNRPPGWTDETTTEYSSKGAGHA
jgi:class 3 adenylate cyclase/predicted ATPase